MSTKDLIKELRKRGGVKDMEVKDGEYYKVLAATNQESLNRHIRASGPATVIIYEE